MTNLAAIDTNYRDIGDTTKSVWRSEFQRVNSPLLARLDAVYEAAQPHTALALGMMWVENQFATTGYYIKPKDNNPMSLRPWEEDPHGLPPGATGIIRTPDTGTFLRFDTPESCLREWKRRLTDPAYKRGVYTGAKTLAQMINIYAPPGDVHGGTGVDNADIGYASTVAGLLRKYAAMEGDDAPAGDGTGGTNGGDDMDMKEWHLPHAPRSLFLPANIPIITKIVTHPRTTNGVRRMPKQGAVGHDTGNPRTNAMAEWNWLAGGRQGGSLGGYTAIVDDQGVIYCQYLDWETWHAGREWWNWYTWGTEMAFGGSVVWTTAFENWCAWNGALLEMGDLDPEDDFNFHEAVYGKFCPAQVFNRGLRQVARQKVASYYLLSRGARTGADVPTQPQYVDPVPPLVNGEVWDGAEDVTINNVKFEAQRVTATTTAPLNRRQWASTESQFTGETIPAGTEVELLGWVAGELVDDISEWWIDTDGNRLWAGGIDVEPKQDPDWPIPPEEPVGIVNVNGRLYYPLYADVADPAPDGTDAELVDAIVDAIEATLPPPLGREITVHRDGNLHKWAGTDSEVVGSVKAGDVRTFKYWTRGEELPLTMADGSEATELIWFAEEVYSGARMWAGLSEERPD